MKKINFKLYLLASAMLLLIKVSFAQQIKLHQSFKSPQVLQNGQWSAYSSVNGVKQDIVDAYQAGGSGSLKVNFYTEPLGNIDSLQTQEFDPTVANDSLFFDHAHVMRAFFPFHKDSMHILSSSDGGANYSFLVSYVDASSPTATSLSTLPTPTTPTTSEFVPANTTDWKSKAIELPVGTNRLKFVFYHSLGNNLYLDNILVGTVPTSCSGAPVVSNLTGGSILKCPGASFYIAPDTFEYNPLISYQWETSPDDNSWTAVTSGIDHDTAEYLGIHAVTSYYRLVATCRDNQIVTKTNSILVTNDSLYNCYCTTNLGGVCGSGPYIEKVKFPSGQLDDSTACTMVSGIGSYSKFGFGPTEFDTITAGNPLMTIYTRVVNTTANVYAWIDYNHNGSFEKEEYIMLVTGQQPRVFSSRDFSIPFNAISGVTGMRIRAVNTNSTLDSSDACSQVIGGGETEDYLVYIKPVPVCNGMPNPGTLFPVVTGVCAGENVEITASGMSYGDGIVYEWQESNDSNTWVQVTTGTGMNTPTLSPVPITNTTYYRLKVSCTHTGDYDYSPVTVVRVNPVYVCTCFENLANGNGMACNSTNPYISHVSITNGLLNNTSLCSNHANNYTFFGFGSGKNDSLHKGQEVTLNVQTEIESTIVGAWIDYNQDAVYDASEYIQVAAATEVGVPSSVHFTIPNDRNVMTGFTGMRIRATPFFDRSVQSFTPTDACTAQIYGETEDYVIYIGDAPICSGAPNAGALPFSSMLTCKGTSAILESFNVSYEDGIVYEWQESEDNGGSDPWTAVIYGANFNTKRLESAPVNAPIYYRLKVSCASADDYGTSVLVDTNSFYNCYCSDNLGGRGGFSCAEGEYIDKVAIVGRNLNNTSTCSIDPVKKNYVTFPPVGPATDTLYTGGVYDFEISSQSSGLMEALWIDFDQSGTFDNNEYYMVTTNTEPGVAVTVRVVVPAHASLGSTGMRVRLGGAFLGGDACLNSYFGETEDYTLYIDSIPGCNGTPSAGTIGSDIIVCSNMSFDMAAPDADFGNGITYQWEESDDNGVFDLWEPAINADNGSDTTRFITILGISSAKYYRLKDSCATVQAVSYSLSKYVGIDSFFNCYTPTANFGGDCGSYIHEVSISNSTISQSNRSGCSSTTQGVYEKFDASALAIDTLLAGNEYYFSASISGSFNHSVGVWIDYNRNGHFGVNEFDDLGFGNVRTPASAPVTIKSYTPVGYTGMRIRSKVQGFVFSVVRNSDTTATYGGDGETEDYIVYIDTLKPSTNLTITNIANDVIDFSWTRGNGDGCIVVATENGTPHIPPTNGREYRFSKSWTTRVDSTGVGNYVIYSGIDADNAIIDLSLFTGYTIYVYEYMNHGRNITYTTIPATVSGTTPVKLINFTGESLKRDVLLNWSTASEVDNKGFAIERSFDGKQFSSVGFVEGAGNSTTIHQYTFTDKQVFSDQTNRAYYRLQQQDNDGALSYSGVVAVSSDKVQDPTVIYPNPFTDKFTLGFSADMLGKQVTVSVYTVLGVQLRTKTIILDKFLQTEMNGMNEWHDGIYMVTVTVDGATQAYRILKGE